jgi:hypothetical protein
MDDKKQDKLTHRPDQGVDEREAEIVNVVDSLP